MVFYFTGTGNSRFIAERVAEILGEKAIDISTYIKENKYGDFKEEGTYIFVAPCYVSAPARAMMDFIKNSSFPKGIKAYFLITAAVYMGSSPAYCKKMAKKKGFQYMGTENIVMPQNYLTYFKTKEIEENIGIVKSAIPEIDKFGNKINEGQMLTDKKIKFLEVPFTELVCIIYYNLFMKTKQFCVSGDCISCGKCVRECPYGNISLKDGKPVWGKKCTHCMACINRCPKTAIEYGKMSIGKPRYPGPNEVLKMDK